tara:strand:- start:450 stop:785 length:336 start_codon:yes stop_codon:yes gene_type:complete
MAILHTKVKKYLEANSKTWEAEQKNIILQNDSNGSGDYIHTWNVSGVAKPTDEQLAAYESSGNTEENNNVVIRNRKSEYGTTEHQIENIIENGLSAEQARVQAIKDKYPKE